MRLRLIAFSSMFGALATSCSSSGSQPPQLETVVATSQSVTVGRMTTAHIAAGAATVTIAVPASTSGNGTLTFIGSISPPAQTGTGSGSPGVGSPRVVSVPETPIASIAVTASDTATYAALPIFTFELPAGTSVTNETFTLAISDPSADLEQSTILEYEPNFPNGAAIVLTAAPPYLPYSPVLTSEPIVPITYSASNPVSFTLYEQTVST